jgi:2-methylcitrate dehydratase PrpD
VQAIEDLKREHGYQPAEVASIHVAGNQKMATVNNIPAPADLMMAQYSLPFCVALAHYRDPRDPASFNAKSLDDPAIRALAQRVTISVAEEAKHGHSIVSTVTVTLNDGRAVTRRVESFKGTPEQPLDRAEMHEKFLLLTKACNGTAMIRLFERLQNIERERNLDWVKIAAAGKSGKPKSPAVGSSRRAPKRKTR